MKSIRGLLNAFLQSDLDCKGFKLLNQGGAAAGENIGAFTDLSDVPHTYAGQGQRYISVRGDETGLQFAAPGQGPQVLYDDTLTVNAPTHVFDPIPGAFTHLRLISYVKTDVQTAPGFLLAEINADTVTNNYKHILLTLNTAGGAVSSEPTVAGMIVGAVNGSGADATDYAYGDAEIQFCNEAVYKRSMARASHNTFALTTIQYLLMSSIHRASARINTLTVKFGVAGANIKAGSRLILMGYV